MSMRITGLKPTAAIGNGFDCGNAHWHQLWTLTREAAPEALSEEGWSHGASGGFGGFVVQAPCAHTFAAAIEQLPRGDVLVRFERLCNRDVHHYLAFLRACGGFHVH